MYRYFKPQTRRLSTSPSLHKDKSKIQLKALGSILSKGKVGKEPQETSTKVPTTAPKTHSLDDFMDVHSKELEECSLNLGFMSKDDIRIQEMMDSGRQFGSTGAGTALKRTAALKSLPDKIDLLKTPWHEIERVYSVLRDLDNDESVHHKYKKRLSVDTKSLVAIRSRRLTDMCKFARRDQKPQLSALDHAYESIYRYNVVGFDRSLCGFPLQSGKHSVKKDKKDGKEQKDFFPAELLADTRPFQTEVPIHKKEVNFMEDDALAETIMPHDIKPNPPEELLSMEGKPIMVADINQYHTLEHQSQALKSKIEDEIVALQRSLSSEISRSTLSLFSGLGRESKANEYLLVSKVPYATKYTGPTFNYLLKHFDMIPFYGSVLQTLKHWRRLNKHLCKVLMINLSEQIDSLTRIKYKSPADRQQFLKKTYSQIQHIVATQLMPLALEQRLKVPKRHDVIVHKPVSWGSFSRMYWARRPRASTRRNNAAVAKRGAQSLDYTRAVRF